MITLHIKSQVPTRDFPEMTRDELNRKRREAKDCFDQALVEKTETDRIYVAAATRLNTLDRLMKKVAQREAVDSRAAAKFLLRTT